MQCYCRIKFFSFLYFIALWMKHWQITRYEKMKCTHTMDLTINLCHYKNGFLSRSIVWYLLSLLECTIGQIMLIAVWRNFKSFYWYYQWERNCCTYFSYCWSIRRKANRTTKRLLPSVDRNFAFVIDLFQRNARNKLNAITFAIPMQLNEVST